MKHALILLTALLGLFAAAGPAAHAGDEQPDKVFVCKYVGTPGQNETLQTGQNPISVSINAIPDFPGVGGFFADAQGRSLVIAFDTGQDEPSCPDGQGCTENCEPPTDFCPTLPGVQAEDEDCPPPPPTDVCPNLEGNQTEVPDGFVLADGQCVLPPPPPCTTNCGPPHQVTGSAAVFCDTGAKLYRTRGTIDQQEADTVDPATIAGNTIGTTNVTIHRGDTIFFTSVTTFGDCNPTIPSVPAVVVTPAATPPAAPPTAKPPVVKPKPPVRKPAAKPKPKPAPKAKPKPHTPGPHVCATLADGTKRAWYKGGNGMPAGCYPIIQGSG